MELKGKSGCNVNFAAYNENSAFYVCQNYLTPAFPKPNRAEHRKMTIAKGDRPALFSFVRRTVREIAGFLRSATRP